MVSNDVNKQLEDTGSFNIFSDKKIEEPVKPVEERIIKDVEPVTKPVQEEPNNVIKYNSNDVDDSDIDKYNIFGSNVNSSFNRPSEISIGNEKANIAVATSSPLEDDEFTFDNLPKVENASIIQPNYASGTSVKTSDSSDYNIYNTIPDIMSNIKEEVKPAEVVKEETKNFVDSIEISKDKLESVSNKLNEYNVYNTTSVLTVEERREVVTSAPVVDKTNVNIDPDKIVINNSNAISDDQFFDDFFGDDE